MGKGRDKRKKAKEESGGRNKAKQDRKQKEKNMEKHSRRLKNMDSDDEKEENVELLLAQYRQKEKKKKEVIIEDCEKPTVRINSTLVCNPTNSNELILFGGEYWNGERTDSYNDLFRYSVDKKQWKTISSPTQPSPRSAHQAVCMKNYMVIYGGEFTSPSQSQFYHHKDLWRLDCNTWQWEEIKMKDKNSPQPRSGHRMTLWKRTVLMFGGFHDTLTTAGHYFDDVWALDNADLAPSWRRIDTQGESPSKRSAVCLSVYADTMYVYGGFSVEGKQQKGVTHGDLYQLNLASCTWNKIKKAGIPPSIRSGITVAVSARKALYFGGVMDYDDKNDLKSRFYNELFVFNMDARRWFPLLLKKKKAVGAAPGKKGKGQQKNDEKDENSLTANLERLGAGSDSESEDSEDIFTKGEMPLLPKAKKKVKKIPELPQKKKKGQNPAKHIDATTTERTGYEINKKPVAGESDDDGDVAPQGVPIFLGNEIIGYEPLPDKKEKPKEVVRTDDNLMYVEASEFEGAKKGFVFRMGSEGLGYYEDNEPVVDEKYIKELLESKKVQFEESVKDRTRTTYITNDAGQIVPCGRFGTQMCCAGNYLYLYGGQFEEGNREVTLSDFFRINLNTLETFEVLEEMDLAEQEWYESEEEDDTPKSSKKKKSSKSKKTHQDSDSEDDDDDEEEEEDEESDDSNSENSDDDSNSEEQKKEQKQSKRVAAASRARSKREQLKEKLGANEGIPTPEIGEALKDFFKRTTEFWIQEASSSDGVLYDRTAADVEKAFRKTAFRFASQRYYECRPILEKLEQFEEQEKKEEEWRQKKALAAKEKERALKKALEDK